MNIYVETNFVLELVFQQEQLASCEQILQLCEAELVQLIIPAYSVAEPHEKLTRQAKNRRDLQQLLETELRQLARSAPYQTQINSIENLASLLVQSSQEERQRFVEYRNWLIKNAEVIALTADILNEAAATKLPMI